jgi:predicted aspartyl protease
MIIGVVRSAEGRIRLRVKARRGREQTIEAVIDTGYTASLTLPPAVIQALGLRWQAVDRFKLADGSICIFDVYEAKVVWDGKVRQILVDEADAEPLAWIPMRPRAPNKIGGVRGRRGAGAGPARGQPGAGAGPARRVRLAPLVR